MPTVLLLGALDTKGDEFPFVRDRLLGAGVDVLLVDFGALGEPGSAAQTSPSEKVSTGTGEPADLKEVSGRGAAMAVMSFGAQSVVRRLYEAGRFDGAVAIGGTCGTSLAAAAFRDLPFGVPKMVISTAAFGDTASYLAKSDLVLVASIADVAGVNRPSARIMSNAVSAMVGMVTSPRHGGSDADGCQPSPCQHSMSDTGRRTAGRAGL